MSFGYGVSDVISVAALCWRVYKKCKNSSGEFKDVAVEVSCLHSVLKETDEVSSEQNLSSQQQVRLKPLKDGILGLLDELEGHLEKYESLGTQSKRTLDRMGWAMNVGVGELRQKLIAQTTLLDAFNNSTSHSRLEHKLNQLISEVRAGKRQSSVISSRTFDSNNDNSWEELRRELEDIGISADVIREKRTFIVAWFEEAVAGGRLEEDKPDSDSDEEIYSYAKKEPYSGSNDEIYSQSEEEPESDIGNEIISDSEEETEHNDEISDITEAQRQGRRPQITQSKTIVKTQESSQKQRPQLIQSKTTFKVDESSQRQITQPRGKRSLRIRKASLLDLLKSDNVLLLRAAEHGDVGEVEYFLKPGVNVNYASQIRPKYTALHWAAFHGNGFIVELLSSKGADIEVRDAYQRTPLHVAAMRGKHLALLSLLNNGADIEALDSQKRTPLHRASSYGVGDTIQLLLERGAKIDAQNRSSRTPLHKAAGGGNNHALLVLLNNSANIEAPDKSGQTPLHRAASTRNKNTVRLLLERGANIDAQDIYGGTPLHTAARIRDGAVVRLLLKRGADRKIKNIDGKRAQDLADRTTSAIFDSTRFDPATAG